VEGRGYAETTVDQRDAKRFFYSMAPERVYYRTLWFGMAGVPMPNHHGMPAMVHRLSSVIRYGRHRSDVW
jgi:hypothetical protein